MDTIFDGKVVERDFTTEYQGVWMSNTEDKPIVFHSALSEKYFPTKKVTLKELIEEEKRLQEEEEKCRLEERQYINNFLRRMIEWVKFDGDWTVVKWFDGKVTKVKKQPGEMYSKEVGLLWCIAKKMFYQNPNILFEVMREFVSEDPQEPTAAHHEVVGKGTFDKDVMQGCLSRLTHWALDVTDALEKVERDEEHADDFYQLFTEIRNDMEDELGVDWV